MTSQSVTIDAKIAPFLPLLNDTSISEIFVSNDLGVGVMRNGRVETVCEIKVTYAAMEALIKAVANYVGRPCDAKNPCLHGFLPTGERFNGLLPPVAQKGCVFINIRKHGVKKFSMADYAKQGYFNETMHRYSATTTGAEIGRLKHLATDVQVQCWALLAEGNAQGFLELAVISKLSMVISGATHSGKTNFLRSLVDLIPIEERILSVEDTLELHMQRENSCSLTFKRDTGESNSAGATVKTVMETCNRMTGSRVVLSELRGDETFYFLQNVLNSGHAGSMTTVHSNSPELCFTRLMTLVKASPEGSTIGEVAISKMLKMLVDIVIQIEYDHKKGRRVSAIYYDPWYQLALT